MFLCRGKENHAAFIQDELECSGRLFEQISVNDVHRVKGSLATRIESLALLLNQVRVARQQRRTLEHPAEILLARRAVFAIRALEALEGFIAHFQPFQLHDAHEIFAALPRLALLQFHAYTIVFPVRSGEC